MKKLILYASLMCMGIASCTKDYLVPEDELPEWLGASIYEELKNPKSLDGTFNTYLRLIDDLAYTDVLSKTGSKTIFPANDAAFEAFFKDGKNVFGVSSYEQLTYNQKAQLLYSSMLDNAVLVGNLSNDQNASGELLQGKVVKHPTNISLVNSVETMFSQSFPKNNQYFDRFAADGGGKAINVVYDNTNAPMVHFTNEYMLNNNMTVSGDNSDFEVITGEKYVEGSAYVYSYKVVKENVTCQNGYIHQLNGVLASPGNMAQCLRNEVADGIGTGLFSRMMDYYCAPFNDNATKTNYNAWAVENNTPTVDNIYAIRYFSKNSQRTKLNQYVDDEGKKSDEIPDAQLLNFDPGWNYYNPTLTAGTTSNDAEIAAILAPTDNALWNYFKENGEGGAYIIKNLGKQGLSNTFENLGENLDAVYMRDPSIFANMINNVMKGYFSKTVPSKFATVQNDAFEFMNVTLDDVHKKEDGKYDVLIANNGVIYKMDKFFAPQLYNSVLGPASVYTNMRCMGQMFNDHSTVAGVASKLGADMYYYLMSMTSKYAAFVPEDNGTFIYVDPTSIYDSDGLKALRFRWSDTPENGFNVMVQKGLYVGGQFSELADYQEESIGKGTYKTQIQDMLNYHTVVLNSSDDGLNGNHFYKTKHGGAVFIPDGYGYNGSVVKGGCQIDGSVESASVKSQYSRMGRKDADPEANIQNGTCYLINRPIQPTITSAYKILNSDFKKFTEFMNGFDAYDKILSFAGISDEEIGKSGTTAQTAYKMFVINHEGFGGMESDYRLRMLSAYNYTIYAPTDAAMDAAYAAGLPTWGQMESLYDEWEGRENEAGYKAASAKAKKMIDVMRSFVFYHIQNSSVFADNTVSAGTYQTFCTDAFGIAQPLTVSGGSGILNVKDAAGKTISLKYGDKNVNVLARDVDMKNSDINSSAFVTIHGVSTPLCFNAGGRYDDAWATASAKKHVRK